MFFHPGGLDSLTLKTDGLVIGTQNGLHGNVFIFDLESDVPDPERRRSLADPKTLRSLQPASIDIQLYRYNIRIYQIYTDIYRW